jgi:uncharacterized protein (TIGR00299 family) protein
MRIAYFDCFSGASGDMILGALLDAGLGIERLNEELAKLHLSHYDVSVQKVVKKGIGGSQALVVVDDHHHHHHHRHLHDIEEIISKSDLDDPIKRKSLDIFSRLAQAEAKVHETTVDHIHFHEVGAMDAIIDVVGSVAGLAAMGIERIYCSPLHVGSGTVNCAHGTLPVPAPATAELIVGKPFYSSGVPGELLTPTGAAILTTIASDFGAMPAMTLEKIGYGAGTSDPALPNLLRILIGEATDELRDYEKEHIAVIETNIDDMNPQVFDYLIEKVLEAGALDVYVNPVLMKKNRPGMVVTVTCRPHLVERFTELLLQETTTIGLRWRLDNRLKARRTMREVDTPFGVIRCKVASLDGKMTNITPEYDDCKRVALEKNVPLKTIMAAARAAAMVE